MITSSRIASLLLFLLFIVGGCSGEKLSTDVIPLGPISSDPNARSATPSTSTDKAGAPSAPVGTLVRRAERFVETDRKSVV